MDRLSVKLEAFEGPLDLLYHLIEKNEIDIYDIPIAEITDQYLEHVEAMQLQSMENISEFIVMAATLLEIKSKMLLPRPAKHSEEENDPREELVNRLIEYKRFKQISEHLDEKGGLAVSRLYRRPDEALIKQLRNDARHTSEQTVAELLKDVSIDSLYQIFEQIILRQELKTDKIRSGFNSVKRDLYTIDDKIEYIRDLLVLRNRIGFLAMFEEGAGKVELVVTFLAVLELNKRAEIHVKQDEIFGEIYLTRGEGLTGTHRKEQPV